jgi:hypothetical protein
LEREKMSEKVKEKGFVDGEDIMILVVVYKVTKLALVWLLLCLSKFPF